MSIHLQISAIHRFPFCKSQPSSHVDSYFDDTSPASSSHSVSLKPLLTFLPDDIYIAVCLYTFQPMLCCSKNLSFSKQFLLLSSQISNSPSIFSQCSFSRPIASGVLRSYRNRPVTGTSSPTIVPSALRSDRAMATQSRNPQSVYDFTVKDARGNDVELSKFKGKVLLIVNVASQCGFTNSNYPELTQLYQKYKDQGFEVLAFPCNQFGGQEPGTKEEIENFVCTRFKAEYPIFDKVDVNGSNAAPLYKFLKISQGGFLGNGIKWNFTKFLVDREGKVVDRYAPTTSPLSIEKDIKKLLGV